MDIGVLIFPTDQAIAPVELAREVEARGFESLWFPEHSHIPSSRETPWGLMKDAPPLPEEYSRTYDQFVALSACAAVTERIRLGTGITLVAQRDPVWLAKEVASLDLISGGRFDLGVGFGWNKEEMATHGVDFGKRREIVREKIALMKALWTSDEASYQGEHVSLEPSWAWPKPLQEPHPRIILGGGAGPKMFDAVVSYADGWMPIGGRHSLADGLSGLRQACDAAGRDFDGLHLAMFGAKPDVDFISGLADQGLDRVMLGLPPASADVCLPLLDDWADDILPAFS